MPHPSLVEEGGHEEPIPLEAGEILRRDAATQEDAPGRKHPEGDVPGLGAVGGDERVQRLDAHRVQLIERRAGDDRGWILLCEPLGQRRWLRHARALAEEAVDRTRPLPDRIRSALTRPFSPRDVLHQLRLEVVPRREVGVSALGGERPVALAVPVQPRAAQPRASREDGLVPRRVVGAGLEDGEVGGRRCRSP